MVVLPRLGVVNEVPEPNETPPEEAANQFNVPALIVAPKFNVPASQREAGAVVVITGIVFTVATMAILGEEQELETASA